MAKDGGTPRPFPPLSSFSTSTLTLCITTARLFLIFGLIPEEIALFLRLPSVQSTIVPSRETLRYLQVASSFRHLFPSTSQAYIASSSPPSVLVWILHLALEKWWAPIPEYWRGVLWRVALLLVDYMIATLLERIATSSLQSEEGTMEEELLVKMPAAIQPPRARLFEIASSTNAKQNNDTQDTTPPMITTAAIPTLAANLYYASFITMLSSGVYDSFQNVYCLLVLWSVYEIIFRSGKMKRISLAAVALALATYVHPWSMVFAVPICVSQRSDRTASVFAVLFVASLLWLQLLAFMLLGTKAYWTWKPVEALTPNLGPLWYFQMQLFNRFHDYFALMITGMPYLVVIPLTIRLHRYPIVLVTCLCFVGTLFDHNPTLFDFNVAMCLTIMSPRSLARMNAISLIAMCSIAVPILLYILDYGLWLESGSGNANYIFFQCLAYNAFVAMVFLDFVGASLQRDKALRITEKLISQSSGSDTAVVKGETKS